MKTIYSNFWLQNNRKTKYNLADPVEEAMKLVSHRHAISNFVKIVTKKDIPVYYKSGNQSRTNSKCIILSGDIEKNSIDATVGLALHEASHIIHSDFDILSQIEPLIPNDVYEKSLDLKIDRKETILFVKDLTNWIEDRRIDYWMYNNAIGYRGYYIAMYNIYEYSEETTSMLLSDECKTEDMDSYFFRTMNIINKKSDLTALKGLQEIYDVINIQDIHRLKTTQESFIVGLSIYKIMLKYVNEYIKQDSDESDDGKDNEEGGDNEDTTPNDSQEKSARNEKLQNNQNYIKQRKFIRNEVDKDSIKNEDVESLVNEFSDGKVEIKDVEYTIHAPDSYKNQKIKVIVVKKITEALLKTSVLSGFTNSSGTTRDNVNRGIVLGKMLGKKLKIRNEDRKTIFNRKKRGKIEKRLVAELGFDNFSIFKKSYIQSFADAILHISIDASSSMYGSKFSDSIVVAVAIAKAAKMIKGIEVVISLRGNSSSLMPVVLIAYDSRRDNFSVIEKYFPLLKPESGTPEGLCYAAIIDEMVQSSKNIKSYFLNLCDGYPEYIDYAGMPAAIHTRGEVEKMRRKGIDVMAYYIGNDTKESELFKIMFGKDAKFINTNNVVEIAKTLNNLFLSDSQKTIINA